MLHVHPALLGFQPRISVGNVHICKTMDMLKHNFSLYCHFTFL